MSVFRPSARARLQLRLDEGLDTAALQGQLERGTAELPTFLQPGASGQSVEQQLDANRQQRNAIQRARELLPEEDLEVGLAALDRERRKLQLAGDEQDRPEAVDGPPPDDLVVTGGIQPLSCSITRNGLEAADEADLEVDFRDAPIDPRTVRAAFVELVIGLVGPEEYEQGILQGARRDDGSLLSLVERRTDQDTQPASTTRFVGFVDEWHVEADAEAGDVVRIRCRDVSALLRDRRLPLGAELDLAKPIADAVQELVARFTSTRSMKVFFRDASTADRGPVPADKIPAVRKARRGRVAKRAKPGGQRVSVWDHIVETCLVLGLTPTMRGYELILVPGRAFLADAQAGRRMVYGRNVGTLEFSRKVGGVKVPTVEVRSYDPQIGRTRWARAPRLEGVRNSGVYGRTDPPVVSRVSEVGPAGTAGEDLLLVELDGVSDVQTLEEIAATTYEQAGRQEIEGSFRTDEITSVGSAEEGDLLGLQSGDAVEVLVALANEATTGDPSNATPGSAITSLQELQSQGVARRKGYLRTLGWSEEVAAQLAEAQERTALFSTFRVDTVQVDWDRDTGVSVEADFRNFVVVERESPGSVEQGASEAVSTLTAGAESGLAAGVREASAAGATLGAQAQEGEVGPEEYGQQGTATRGRQRRRTQELRRTGG